MLVMQCTSELELRGMASADEDAAAKTFGDLIQDAHCAITVDTGERPYQGIVEIERSSLADSLENYFARSVQVPSHVALVSDESLSGGILLQQMPGQQGLDDDDWNRLGYLAATLRTRDLGAANGVGLIGNIFAEDDVRVFEPKPVVFRCRCSRGRAEEVLRMLGESETREVLAERGQVDVTCEYCGRRREFDPIDISGLFTDNAVAGPDSVQ
jgi:molecular chaperone Hsp33